MSRRTLPPIAPTDLRDHADEDRIGRIWDRIEHDLAGTQPVPRRSSSVAVLLLAATFAAFGGGLLLGKVMWREPPLPSVSPTPSLDRQMDLFAAGSQSRTFSLPGGGEITLRPGATVELERGDADALTLRLVQGEATVDSELRTAAFSVVVGDARLQSKPGSVLRVVRRDADHMDVHVQSGAVSLTSPSRSRMLQENDQEIDVPLHTVTAVVSPTNGTRREKPAPSASPADGQPVGEPPVAAVAAAADWRTATAKGDNAGAFKLLREQPGGVRGAINAAKDAKELMDIADVARGKGGDLGEAIVAFTRVVDLFPNDPNASLAALSLAGLYEKTGQWAKAQQYYQRAQSSPYFADDASCRQLRAELRHGNKDDAARMAKEYLAKHPEGRCRDEAGRISKGEDTSKDEEPATPETDGGAR